MVWGTYAVKIEVKMGICLCWRVLRLARMLCPLMYRQHGDLANLSGGGGGVHSLFGRCPNRTAIFFIGSSLIFIVDMSINLRGVPSNMWRVQR